MSLELQSLMFWRPAFEDITDGMARNGRDCGRSCVASGAQMLLLRGQPAVHRIGLAMVSIGSKMILPMPSVDRVHFGLRLGAFKGL
jgi:hypothetical protein